MDRYDTNKRDEQLVKEWLACERTCGDSEDANERKRANDRQLEIEREQTRRMMANNESEADRE